MPVVKVYAVIRILIRGMAYRPTPVTGEEVQLNEMSIFIRINIFKQLYPMDYST